MHSLILGLTRSGKTTLAVKLGREFKAQGWKVGVYTVPATLDVPPKADPRWAFADFVTLDRAKFLEQFRRSWKVMWFIDECNRTVGWNDPEMEGVATSGSLNGATVHFISQRAATFNKTVREQCTRLYLFRQGPDDCKTLNAQWGHPEILRANDFDKGQALFCTTAKGSVRYLDLGIGQAPRFSHAPRGAATAGGRS